jgi:hypothetical protein
MEKGLKVSAKTNSKVFNESIYNKPVDNLIYFTATRSDLNCAVSYISQFMQAPKLEQWTITQRVLWYAKRTMDVGILYGRSK